MRARIPLGLGALLAAALLAALGVWQVERRAWKLALIARVDARLAAEPVPAPGPERWSAIGADDAYTRVTVRGRWLPVRPAYAQAVTDLGPGFWVVAPVDTGTGIVMVNRGFVAAAQRGRERAASGAASVAGLLRVSEPGGGFLRRNDPAGDRWYSRDVAAIARARGLSRPVAPYFVDADAGPQGGGPDGWPRGGLTVVRFRNSHLTYAVTWFTLSAMMAYFAWRIIRAGPARDD